MAGQICSSSFGRFRLFRGNSLRAGKLPLADFFPDSGLFFQNWETASGRLGRRAVSLVSQHLTVVVKLLISSYSKTNKMVICQSARFAIEVRKKGGLRKIYIKYMNFWVRVGSVADMNYCHYRCLATRKYSLRHLLVHIVVHEASIEELVFFVFSHASDD